MLAHERGESLDKLSETTTELACITHCMTLKFILRAGHAFQQATFLIPWKVLESDAEWERVVEYSAELLDGQSWRILNRFQDAIHQATLHSPKPIIQTMDIQILAIYEDVAIVASWVARGSGGT